MSCCIIQPIDGDPESVREDDKVLGMFTVKIMPRRELDWVLLAISTQGRLKRVVSISLSTVESRVYFLVVSLDG